MSGRLNIFQRTMLLWDELHPYHAFHVVRVFAPLDSARLNTAVNRTLAAHKLSRVTLNPEQGTYAYAGAAADFEIRPIKIGDDPLADLAAEATRQLNTRFSRDQSFLPFRFFVSSSKEAFFFGLVYFHPVADGEAVVKLLKEIVDAYEGRPEAAATELYPAPRDGLLFRDPVLFGKKLWALVGQLRTLRRVRRVKGGDVHDMTNAVQFFSLTGEDLRVLLQTAKTWGVTLNDLFLALLLQAFARLLPAKPSDPQRPKLAVGCIVNLRKELGLAGQQVFGLFLGSFVVACEPGTGMGLPDLAREVRQQTARIKANRLSVGTPLELRFAKMLLRCFSLERRKKFYQKNYPLWGGLTNMNLDAIWQPQPGARPVDYFRAVSTGPATPLVLSITTIGGGVNLGLSYRTACYSTTEVEQVKYCFLESVQQLRRPT